MSASRLAFLSSLVVGSVVHYQIDERCRVDAVVTKAGKRGFEIVTQFSAVEYCDKQGYGSTFARIEDAAGVAADDWNAAKAAMDQKWRDNRPANAPFFG